MTETVTEPQTAGEIVRSFDPPAIPPGAGQQVAERSATPTGGLLSLDFAALARDPDVDADKLDKLLRMYERLQDRDAEREFDRAFIEMKPHLPVVEKDGRITYEAKQGKAGAAINYATLEGIDEEITPILQCFGFAVGYRMKREAEGQVAICILRHKGGHKTETDGPTLPCDSSGGKNNIQGWGSAQKYGCRYALVAALNIRIKGKDDDGKLAGFRYITDAQAADVRKLMVETGTVEAKFCEFIRVAQVEMIQAGELAMVTNMLLSKRKTRRAGEEER